MTFHATRDSLRELRLFLEEICCDLCRAEHTQDGRTAPESIKIRQEFPLNGRDEFADIRVQIPGGVEYFVEVKFGYDPEALAARLKRKYGAAQGKVVKVVVVTECRDPKLSSSLRELIRGVINPAVEVEIWDEQILYERINRLYNLSLERLETEEEILELRQALDAAKGRFAFEEDWVASDLQVALLWHFSFWHIRQIRRSGAFNPRNIMPPGMYKGVVAVIADLCSFSCYMRDTRDNDLVRHCLTSFYSKARNEILNAGGMMLQFVGDEVIGLFGLPDQAAGYCEAALATAESLLSVGASVSNEWQRHLDRAQNQRGVHIGIAMGDLQIVSLRPFGRAHLGAVSDTINMAARLLSVAGPDEIVVSNSFLRKLSTGAQSGFRALEPVDARNMGRIAAWKRGVGGTILAEPC